MLTDEDVFGGDQVLEVPTLVTQYTKVSGSSDTAQTYDEL